MECLMRGGYESGTVQTGRDERFLTVGRADDCADVQTTKQSSSF
jgi:hypothetical protein